MKILLCTIMSGFCKSGHIFEPLCVYELSFNTEKMISSEIPYHLIKGWHSNISCMLIFLLGQDESQGTTVEMADSQK